MDEPNLKNEILEINEITDIVLEKEKPTDTKSLVFQINQLMITWQTEDVKNLLQNSKQLFVEMLGLPGEWFGNTFISIDTPRAYFV